MYDGLLKFIKDAAARFSAIARSVGSRPEELHADAVFVVDDIARKRGRPVDFDNAADQGLVINGVYWSAKGQKDWRLSRAYSINDDREGVTRWADRLAAPESSCPMNILLYREDALAATGPYAHTYTQVAAYHFAIINLAYEDLCNRLMVSPRTILNRVVFARELANRQHSLFDKVEVIKPAFEPAQARGRSRSWTNVAESWEQRNLQL